MRGLSLVAASGGYSLVVVCWLPIALASLAVAPRLESTGSALVAHGLSCPAAHGIFPTRHQTGASCISRQMLNHWTTTETFTWCFGKMLFKTVF